MKERVLVVDDDTALAEMIGIVLRGEGFEPSFCADGDSALAAFRANKPDVVVEYNFCQVAAGAEPPKPGEPCKAGEKFFNKTNPQNLNAQTLPPGFDLAQGHQLQSGQAVPLASFPEGQYRLEIKVTDKLANKTLTRDVNFSVNPS